MGDASEGIADLQDRVRRIVTTENTENTESSRRSDDAGHEAAAGASRDGGPGDERHGFGQWINQASPDLEQLIHNSVERVFRMLDLPRRSDVESLNENLERVAAAVETLEEAFADRARPPSHEDSSAD